MNHPKWNPYLWISQMTCNAIKRKITALRIVLTPAFQ